MMILFCNYFVFLFYSLFKLCKGDLYTPMTSYEDFLNKEIEKHNPHLKVDDIKSLKNYVENDTELKQVKDKELIIFLHSASFIVDDAYKTIKYNYEYRSLKPVYFTYKDLTSQEMIQVKNIIGLSILRSTTEEWHIYAQLKINDASNFIFDDVIHYFFMIIEYLIKTQGAVNKVIFTFNFLNFSFMHSLKLKSMNLFPMLTFLKNGLPIRVHRINLLNCNYFINIIMNKFLDKSTIDMITFINDPKEILNEDTKDIMPSNIGGNGDDFIALSDKTYDKMVKFQKDYKKKKEKNNI
ncbi:uncharacterized protein LOC126899672 [Daktulosphaira vitifoliae]|uniref:uncharacterized protein LOC126899672 n=1 Tax=Daktulosphaira vitifoliae TaxID=58002 RepID=UPI0021AA36C0|nr:uncharacterized protein LOC126899672 [Daktulosphaira vitifoliae]